MKNKIAIVGVGGRTGTMFAFELGKQNQVLGISRESTIRFLKENNLKIKKGDSVNVFKGRVISDEDFSKEDTPDILFLTNRNPISKVLKYYFQRCGKKKPIIVLSQNGIEAISSARRTLNKIAKPNEVKVVRMALFNAIDRNKNTISYSSPVKVAIAQAFGSSGVKKVEEVLKKSGFQVDKFSKKNAKNLEFSKLFLNLVGMASASRGISIKTGFNNKEVFKEEVKALKEYINLVKLVKGKFLNFSSYPVKLLTSLLSLPTFFLIPFRNLIADLITKGRGNKPKDLGEIDYYNGGVIKLAEKMEKNGGKKEVTREFLPKVVTNQKIYWRAVEGKK